MPFFPNDIKYSEIYKAGNYQYMHVILPRSHIKMLSGKLMKEKDWKLLGVKLSSNWENYLIFTPEPHVLLFRKKN